MRKFVASCLLGLAAMATVSSGAESRFVRPISQLGSTPTLLGQVDLPMPAPLNPVPEVQYSGPIGEMPVMHSSVELYQNVKYRQEFKAAPCAKPIIVQVPDPCACKTDCCTKACVNVRICAPECGCPKVKVTRCGNKVRYDYGKYAIDIVSAHGRVVVDYDR